MPSAPPSATPIDAALRARALRITPGGMTGHLSAAYLPPGYPQFFARGDGCRLWDVDGREYIDFMCSWGPNLLGHHHPEVEAAAARQRGSARWAIASTGPRLSLWSWPKRWWRASRTQTG